MFAKLEVGSGGESVAMGMATRHAMRSKVIWVRSYAERLPDGQWQGFCVTFNLAAQADSSEGVRAKLTAMIDDYLHAATQGPDAAHASVLLSRRAPLYFWLKYFYIALKLRVHAFSARRAPFVETFTFPAPQAC
ncbi:MAG TPA: hypothetical protein VFY97_06985 [Rhodanobacteraceae bacterium]|nr:hypothetical protein [Rhodanobacteraceae bacterium]